MRHGRVAALLLAASMTAAFAVPAMAAATRLISVSTDEEAADAGSVYATISDNGRYVAFESEADNLSLADDDDVENIFVRDHQAGTTVVVSIGSDGTPADGSSERAEISGNGRYICFESVADNLSLLDDNNVRNIFVHNRVTGNTSLVSRPTAEAPADGDSEDCSISDDGRFVAFESEADNLSENDADNDNIFVRDRSTGRTSLVSRGIGGAAANSDSGEPVISGNGRYIAFESSADNLTSNDGNESIDIFLYDRESRRMRLVSRRSNGGAANNNSLDPAIGNGGRYIAFESDADNLSGIDNNSTLDIFVRDRKTGKTRLVSRRSDGAIANDLSSNPGLSGNGRFVLFQSGADNLSSIDINDHMNAFVRDLKTNTTRFVSRRTDGGAADGSIDLLEPSAHRAISETGAFVVFSAQADNLSEVDNNDHENIFRRGSLI